MPILEKQVKSCNQNTQDLDIEKNQEIQEYLNKLSATLETNYSLWKAKNTKATADTSLAYQEAGRELGQKRKRKGSNLR